MSADVVDVVKNGSDERFILVVQRSKEHSSEKLRCITIIEARSDIDDMRILSI